MADQQQTPGPSAPKAIASLAKKQGDVTRLGTQKLKFVPTLPARRKKEDAKKEEAPAPAPSASTERGRGRGGDRGRGRGRGADGAGRGRGAPPPRPPPVEMTASGPFAMGPALAGTSARRTAPRSNFAPIVPQGPDGGAKLGTGLTQTGAPALKREKEPKRDEEDEAEAYSDPDEGVEIVDMENIRTMDWMAPETLGREKVSAKGKKKEKGVKKEEQEDKKGKGIAKEEPMDVDRPSADSEEPEEVNLANAVDLSESEDEEELEDIIDDFALAQQDPDEDSNIRQERLYFFQFPTPFPTFVSASATSDFASSAAKSEGTAKKVSFAQDTKLPAPLTEAKKEPEADGAAAAKDERQRVDGVVGQLEIYESGAVKMRLGNGVLLDVTAATQPSFLQQAVYLDRANKRLCVLGEVNRRFVLSPDIDTLLSSMEIAEHPEQEQELEGLIAMDAS